MDRRKTVEQLLGQDALDGDGPDGAAVQADVDALRQVSATTNLTTPKPRGNEV